MPKILDFKVFSYHLGSKPEQANSWLKIMNNSCAMIHSSYELKTFPSFSYLKFKKKNMKVSKPHYANQFENDNIIQWSDMILHISFLN